MNDSIKMDVKIVSINEKKDSRRGSKYLSSFRTNKFINKKFNLPVSHKLVQSFLKSYRTIVLKLIIKTNHIIKEKRSFLFSITRKIILKLTNNIFQSFVLLSIVFIYITLTYFPMNPNDINDSKKRNIVRIILLIEFIFAIFITINYLFKLLNSKNKLKYIIQFYSVIDFMTFFSIFMNFFFSGLSDQIAFLRIFRGIRLLRLVRILELVKNKDKNDFILKRKNDRSYKIIAAIINIISYLFLFTGILNYFYLINSDNFKFYINQQYIDCDNNSTIFNEFELTRTNIDYKLECQNDINFINNFSFDMAFYFLVVTMTTVGYGDIYPISLLSKMYVAMCVIILIIILSLRTREISDDRENKSLHQVPYDSLKSGKHLVLTGYINPRSLNKFLSEFYHVRHSLYTNNVDNSLKMIIVQPNLPDNEVEEMISSKFDNKVYYIIGDIINSETQKLCDLKNALACFMLSDITNNIDSDRFLLYNCKSISQFYNNLKIFVTLNKATSMDMDWCDWTHAFSIQQIKNNIIVKSSLIPGFATLMMNLFCTSSGKYIKDDHELPWMLEYIYGTCQELYLVKQEDKRRLEGLKFSDLALKTYQLSEIAVLGVKKKIFYNKSSDIFYYEYLINPVDYVICREDELIIIAEEEKYLSYLNNLTKIPNIYPSSFAEDYLSSSKFRQIRKSECDVVQKASDFFNLKKDFKIKIYKDNSFSHHLSNHVLIFCRFDSLQDFIPVFYEHYIDEYLFFISPNSIIYLDIEIEKNNKKLNILRKKYPKLIKIECDYHSLEQLTYLNLDISKHAFILSFSESMPNQYDSGILNLIKIIEEHFKKCKFTVDLINEHNINFLENWILDKEKNSNNDESQFYDKNTLKKLPKEFWPRFSQSHIFLSTTIDYILPFSFHNSALIEVISKFLGLDKSKHQEMKENSSINAIRYIGKYSVNYEEIYRLLIKLNTPMICLGVYRNKIDKNFLKNKKNYLITNPKRNLVVYSNDIILCIGKSNEVTLEDTIKYSEKIHKMYSIKYNQINQQKRKISRGFTGICDIPNSPFVKTNIDEFFKEMTNDVLLMLNQDKKEIENYKSFEKEHDSKKRSFSLDK